jgi:dTDP-glucose pyrophosphorylase
VFTEDRNQIRKTYSILGEESTEQIYRLIEKPRTPVNNIMGTGNWIFHADIYGYIDRTPNNVERGEKELPDLIQCAVDEGKIVNYMNIGDTYININTSDDISIAEKVHSARIGTL